MQCPVDGTKLVMTERSGVEIDYCPQCRGVWLDRGEIDKIIERSAAQAAPTPPSQVGYRKPRRHACGYGDHDDRGCRKEKKRGGFL